MKAVALLSGGLDSTVALTALAKYTSLAITFDYGQRAAKREAEASRKICRKLRIRHRVVRLPWLSQITASALVARSRPLPSPNLESRTATQASAKAVWVPNRNGAFINVAAAFAEALAADTVVVGFNKEEATTFPDNSVAYMRAATHALRYSTANNVRIESPTATWDKRRIVREGRRLGAPLEYVWPCYEGGTSWCRRCESCKRTLRALEAP